MVEATGLKNMVLRPPFNDIICLPNFMKIYQSKSYWKSDADRQAGDLTSLLSIVGN
jgi:hypothetical protein